VVQSMSPSERKAVREKVRAHRDRLRRLGLRPIQIWVPDVRSSKFVLAAHKQSLAVAKSSHAKKIKPSLMPSRIGKRN